MYNNDLVSVIIPVYNAEKYISKTLESVLNQSYDNLEIVIVDDCSKDNSKLIIEPYLNKNTKIKYHLQTKNAGAAVARNTALRMASGRYIAFLDSDDLWKPDKIEKQIMLINEKNAAFCYTAIEMIDEENTVIKNKINVLNQLNYKYLLKNTMIATSTVVIDRNIMGDFQMPLIRSGQDYATWLQLLRNGTIAYGINEALVQYRKSSNSLSKNKFKSIGQVYTIQRNYENINMVKASYNTLWFVFYAFKKHFF